MAAISKDTRALVLRSNRFLANSLDESGLVSDEDIEEANEKLLESIDRLARGDESEEEA